MSKTPLYPHRPAERGQAIVEFALILPMLFLMLVGVVYFAMGFHLQQVLNSAAYEGARVWAKNPPGGSFLNCAPPLCEPNNASDTENNFEKYIKPFVRAYVSNNGFDGSKVIFFDENFDKYKNAVRAADAPDAVTITIFYPYNLPIGNFAGAYQQITVSGSCTLKKG
jgi:hypothetical protein